MTLGVDDQEALAALEFRLRTVLPEEYQDCYEEVQPVSMGSAGLKYGSDGKVAWNEMWATFCDLAMAGGPPHKGMLLEPGTQVEIDANSGRLRTGRRRDCARRATGDRPRGPSLRRSRLGARGLSQRRDGWMAAASDRDGERLGSRATDRRSTFPPAPRYRVEKEIKNVVTVIAKTCHYWTGHMWRAQKREIADLFVKMADVSPLVEPALRRRRQRRQRRGDVSQDGREHSPEHRAHPIASSLRWLARSGLHERCEPPSG